MSIGSFIFIILKWVLIVAIAWLILMQTVGRIIRHFVKFPTPAFLTRLIDNPIRRKFIQNPEIIADRMQLEAGMTVVEIGPGKGSYTKAVARQVLPDGKVYTIDIQESVLKNLKRRIERERISNIVPMLDNAYSLSFEDESIDRIFAVGCLPEIPDPVRALCECRRILKPDGLISLSELFPDPDYPRRSTEKRWAEEAGLELRQQFGTWFTYQLNFGRKAA